MIGLPVWEILGDLEAEPAKDGHWGREGVLQGYVVIQSPSTALFPTGELIPGVRRAVKVPDCQAHLEVGNLRSWPSHALQNMLQL